MNAISPFSNYSFQPIRKSTQSESPAEDDIASLFKPTNKDDLLSKSVEDPDTAWSNWADKEFFHNPFSEQYQQDIIVAVEEACELHKIYENLPKLKSSHERSFSRSFKHLTLLEALLYRYLITSPQSEHDLYASCIVEKKPTATTPLVLSLTLKQQTTILKRWILSYDVNTLRVLISEDGHPTGQIKYIIRDQRLEEIEGTYQQEPLILDPVWHTSAQDTLKEEYITLGKFKTTLIYSRNEKYALYRTSPTQSHTFTEKKVKHYSKDNRTIVTEKTVMLSGYHCLNRIIFAKGYIIPIGGQFFISLKR